MRTKIQYRVVYYENGKKYMGLHMAMTSSEAYARDVAKRLQDEHPEFENVHIEHRTVSVTDWEQ